MLCPSLLAAVLTTLPLATPTDRPDYPDLYRRILAARPLTRATKAQEAVGLAEAAARLWRRTGDPEYKTRARDQFRALLAEPAFSLADFHVLQGFGRLVLLLQEDGLLTPDQDRQVRDLANVHLKAFVASRDDGDNNIRLAQVLGYACLLKYLGGQDDPARAAARKRLDDYWALLVAAGDLDEDASNYDSLGAVFLVDLARVLGREADLRRSAGFRRLFDRFREVVSPAGLIPEYGDSNFGYTGWPMDRVYLLEYAAALYADPTFLHAVRQLTARPLPTLPAADVWARALPLLNLTLSDAVPRAPAGAPSVVTYRARRGEAGPLIDKLILRTGREPGAAMLLLDLYAAGSHAHTEKGPSVAYFEAGQVPLFHNLGRHRTRSAVAGNLLWALPGGQRFPGCWNRPDEWFTMSIPTTYLDRQEGRPVLPPTMLLRNFQEHNRGCRAVWFDNLRLEGPGGSRLVDDFEDPGRWDAKFRKLTGVALSEDHTQGRAAEKAAWQAVPSVHITRRLASPPPGPFDPAAFPYLRLDLKYEGARPYAHVRGLGRQLDLGDQSLPTEIKSAAAVQRGADAYGRIEYRWYLTPDSTLIRHLVLTAEGYLVIHDVLTPGPRMKGWAAGQLWQLYALKARGEDWFCGDDDGGYPVIGGKAGETRSARLLVRYGDGGAGVEEVRQGYHDPNPRGRKAERFFTTFSRRPITPGQPEAFTMVVVPHAPDEDPVGVAGRVTVVRDAAGAHVTVGGRGDGPRVGVRVGGGTWAVSRTP